MAEDVVAAIDEALGCQECGGDLAGSVSADFCSESCQDRWHGRESARPGPLDIAERTTPTLADWFDQHAGERRGWPTHH